MNTNLRDLVSSLPEVYQTIFGHSEWDEDVSRNCNERLDIIIQNYLSLSKKLQRPLRVLDLGCAQGFFSLSLAKIGAIVHGVDFLEENINVCKALAEEYDDFLVTFEKNRIEDIIENIESEQYDFVIGLSVFHHVIHEHGIEKVKLWILKLTNSVHAVILELALKSEPLYWAVSQPSDPRELIDQCSFYQQIAEFPTHLSSVDRPMYLISNDYLIINDYCESFDRWSLNPYENVVPAHKGSRRYFYGENIVCKLYYFSTLSGDLLPRESQRNLEELKKEINFLSSPPVGFPVAKFYLGGFNKYEGWLVMERFKGSLLLERIKKREKLDVDSLISQILNQLVILEINGLYHDDVRTWNIIVDDDGTSRLIDYGSISAIKEDCVWPENIFQSFAILVNEIVVPEIITGGFLRPAAISPFHLPEVYANWLFVFWNQPVSQWSFSLLSELYNKKDSLPRIAENVSGFENWIRAQERVIMHNQLHIYQLDSLINECKSRIANIEFHLEHGVSKKISSVEYDIHSNVEKIDKYTDDFLRRFESLESFVDGCVDKKIKKYEENNISEQVLWKSNDNGELNLEEQNVINTLSYKELNAKLEAAEQTIYQLTVENSQLNNKLYSILHSRSWRITAWWRHIAHPVKVRVMKPIVQMTKKVLRCLLIKLVTYLKNRPLYKRRVQKFLSITGLYSVGIKIYQRYFPVPKTESVNIEPNQKELIISYNDNNQLPPLIADIYLKLRH